MERYCKLSNGELIPERTVDNALELVVKLKGGFSIVELSDDEIIMKGTKLDAILSFRRKHNVGLAEAKAAIEYLRGEK